MADKLFFQQNGVENSLTGILGVTASPLATGIVYLFQNNITVSDSTLIGALTNASFPGYAGRALSSGLWAAVSYAGGIASISLTSALNYVCTGGSPVQNIYGGLILDSTNSVLLAAWNFASGPYPMVNNNDTINVNPTITLQSVN